MSAPRVVLLHGTCFGPETMGDAARALARHLRVTLVHRAGYGRSAGLTPGDRMDDHVADVLAVVDAAGGDVILAGVSGGATVALAAAMRDPRRVRGVVAHEPALGPLAPGVAALLARGLEAVRAAPRPEAAAEAMGRLLAGDGWDALPAALRAEVTARGPLVAREVPAYVAFHPAAGDMHALRDLPVVSSVGALSGPARAEAARVLADGAGAHLSVVPRCGHLVQLDAPTALVDAVAHTLEER